CGQNVAAWTYPPSCQYRLSSGAGRDIEHSVTVLQARQVKHHFCRWPDVFVALSLITAPALGNFWRCPISARFVRIRRFCAYRLFLLVYPIYFVPVLAISVARRRSLDSSKTRIKCATSYGRSSKVSGSHSLRGVAKKSPPYTWIAAVIFSSGLVTECITASPRGITSFVSTVLAPNWMRLFSLRR